MLESDDLKLFFVWVSGRVCVLYRRLLLVWLMNLSDHLVGCGNATLDGEVREETEMIENS